MIARVPLADGRTLTALLDALMEASAEFPKLKKVLMRARDISHEKAVRAKVRALREPAASSEDAEAREAAAVLIEHAMRLSEERAAMEAIERKAG